MMAIGFMGWWYNWYLAASEGYFRMKLTLLAPLGIFGGLLFLFRPQYAGPIRQDSTRAHRFALATVIAAMAIFSAIDFYRLKTSVTPNRPTIIKWTPERGTPSVSVANAMTIPAKSQPEVRFQARTYRLGSFNQKHNPMWEFVTPNENVNNWTTLLTLVDRADASSREDLDRLATGLMSSYEANKGRILLAKTFQDKTGAPYNYMVAAFDQPNHGFELNFVKIALAGNKAYVAIYGVRTKDGKNFLNQHSTEIGSALNDLKVPDLDSLPRRTF
jgi:hypothetical protein